MEQISCFDKYKNLGKDLANECYEKYLKIKEKTMSEINTNELISFIERIESLESEAANITQDIKSIYSEVKSAGYDPKYVKKMVALRKKDADEIYEEDALLTMYRKALNI